MTNQLSKNGLLVAHDQPGDPPESSLQDTPDPSPATSARSTSSETGETAPTGNVRSDDSGTECSTPATTVPLSQRSSGPAEAQNPQSESQFPTGDRPQTSTKVAPHSFSVRQFLNKFRLCIVTFVMASLTALYTLILALDKPSIQHFFNPTWTIAILSVLSAISVFFWGILVCSVFEQMRWSLACNEDEPLNLLDSLALSSSTSSLGVIRIVLDGVWRHGILHLHRILQSHGRAIQR